MSNQSRDQLDGTLDWLLGRVSICVDCKLNVESVLWKLVWPLFWLLDCIAANAFSDVGVAIYMNDATIINIPYINFIVYLGRTLLISVSIKMLNCSFA